MSSLDPLVKFSSLVFIVFTLALSLAILLPKLRRSRPYNLTVEFIRPVLPYLGWVLFLVGAMWTGWGLFQESEMKLIVGLGVTWAVLGTYVVRVGYGADSDDATNATDLKVITLCVTFSFAFLFLLLYGDGIARVLK